MPDSFGTVRFYDSKREYGFISADDGGADLYLHRKQMLDGVEPEKGMRVEYLPTLDEQRGTYWARAVRVL